MEWKVGDWVVLDLEIGQIVKLDPWQEFSDGSFNTSGSLMDRFRPLTLRNKAIIEYFNYYYDELRKISGNAGFNYPCIFQHFAELSRLAIDSKDSNIKEFQDLAKDFLDDARSHKSIIQGVQLFRPAA